jgi:hypothetical protein
MKPPISYPRFSRRWNERLVHAGVGDLASPMQTADNYDESNKRREEYRFQQYCNKAIVGCYLCHFYGTFSINTMILDKIDM